MITAIGNFLGAVLAILTWLFSPEQVAKRKEDDAYKANQNLRKAIATDDAAAVSATIDRLRERIRVSARDK